MALDGPGAGRAKRRLGWRRGAVRVAHVCTVDLSLRYLLGNQMQHLQRAGFDVIGISTPEIGRASCRERV